MNPLDIALQSVVPTVMVPKYGNLPPMTTNGHRFLVAADGLWLEVKRNWLDLRLPLARQNTVAMPYGNVESVMEFASEPLPSHLVEAFAVAAQKASPIETAGWIVRNHVTGVFRLLMLESIEESEAHVHFVRPELDASEEMVIDLHSHGVYPAFFSGQDDIDDAGEVKISVVVGDGNEGVPSVMVRLCALGMAIKLPEPPLFKEVQHGRS